MPVEPERSIAEEPPLAEPSSGPKQQVIVEDDEILPIRQKKGSQNQGRFTTGIKKNP